jgi:hypothetical protein
MPTRKRRTDAVNRATPCQPPPGRRDIRDHARAFYDGGNRLPAPGRRAPRLAKLGQVSFSGCARRPQSRLRSARTPGRGALVKTEGSASAELGLLSSACQAGPTRRFLQRRPNRMARICALASLLTRVQKLGNRHQLVSRAVTTRFAGPLGPRLPRSAPPPGPRPGPANVCLARHADVEAFGGHCVSGCRRPGGGLAHEGQCRRLARD